MRRLTLSLALIFASAFAVSAQEFNVSFGGGAGELDAPIEIVADALSVDQATGQAVFEGAVAISQGEMQIEAELVNVLYSEADGTIAQLLASGDVIITSGTDRATADAAEYDVESGVIRMSGNVTLLQAGTSISAGTMDVNLSDGTAALKGRVRTVLQTGNN